MSQNCIIGCQAGPLQQNLSYSYNSLIFNSNQKDYFNSEESSCFLGDELAGKFPKDLSTQQSTGKAESRHFCSTG